MSATLTSVLRRLSRQTPSLDVPSARAWFATGPSHREAAQMIGDQLMLAAGALAAVSVALPPAFADARLAFGTAGLMLGLSLYLRLWIAPRRLDAERSISAIVLIVTIVVMEARPMGFTPLLYLWPLLLAAHIAPPGRLRADVLLALAGFTFALVTAGDAAQPITTFVVVSVLLLAATLAYRELRMHLALLHWQLEEVAARDPRTGALNDEAFALAFDAWANEALHQRVPTSLVMFDIDQLQKINDSYGHEAGDAVLAHVATVAADALRATDALGRIGEDEFAVLLPATDAAAATAAAERLRAAVERRATECGVPYTVSVGVAGGEAFSDPWAAASHALNLAKSAGSNRVVAAETETASERTTSTTEATLPAAMTPAT